MMPATELVSAILRFGRVDLRNLNRRFGQERQQIVRHFRCSMACEYACLELLQAASV
jgi:hypothetical protein